MRHIDIQEERHSIGGEGVFYFGKAEDVSRDLAQDYCGKIKLIYLDPPFGTGDSFSVKLDANGKKINIPAYSDKLSEAEYLKMMRTVLTNCHALLCSSGSIYLHIDYRMNAKLRLLMDEIFGASNFMNEIVWCYHSGGRSTKHFPRKHDTILFYRKSKAVHFNIAAVGIMRGEKKRNNMKKSVDSDGRTFYSIRTNGKLYKYYADTKIFPSDVWDDIEHLQQRDPERTGFGTQKPLALLKRIILASSDADDIVLDLFSGSGTTAAAACALNRRYIVSDISPIALSLLRARQIKSAISSTMFSAPGEMRIIHDLKSDNLQKPDMSLNYTTDGAILTLNAYSGGLGISLLALGTYENGIFVPTKYAFSPAFGDSFMLPEKQSGSLAIMICDYNGSYNFFSF